MLNILWIEDEYSEQKQKQWFKDRIVTVKNSFDEAASAIKANLFDYDVVVLDINLENSEHSENVKKYAARFGLSVHDFLERSGMNLYFMLLENGFPIERIVFLTANANATTSNINDLRQAFDSGDDDNFGEILSSITNGFSDKEKNEAYQFINDPDGCDEDDITALCNYLESYFISLNEGQQKNTYEILRDTANSCRIEVPKAFNKGSNQLDIELKKHEGNKYLVLRRGVIDGCGFLKQQLQAQEEFLQFREFIKDKENHEITATEIINYLDTLALSLVARIQTDQESLNIQYRLFLRTLVHEWEENIEANSFKEKYGNNLESIRDIYTFGWTMKMTRNWVAHAKLLEPLNAQFIAFLFLINMRAMFRLPKAIQSYEEILLQCISLSPANGINIASIRDEIKRSEENIDDLLIRMNNIHTDEKSNLILTYVEKKENKTKRLKYFNDKINEIYRYNTGQSDAEDHNYKRFLLQYFWVNQKSDLINLTANSYDFLPTLARHIYNDSF
ncbi:response regulator [Methylomonas sp. SURF-2]|uniref:Response regulator n=1 Tax=Methylomonas subterranea TaxID=2952225 RepID=A0ABT1TFT6_9GAMM|nr:response regulator [Methylomonas sp. SURF-2]MCQ8104322.1 response regulator [Methylomonas sp. SURF-2]